MSGTSGLRLHGHASAGDGGPLGGVIAQARLPQARCVSLTNKSGGSLVAGDVVIVDTANNTAVTTTTGAQSTVPVGVVQETIANNSAGQVAVEGYVTLVNTTASVTRGHYAETSTTVKKATANSARREGSFAIYLIGGTTPSALLFGVPDPASGGGGGGTVMSAKAYGTSADSIASAAEEKVTIGDATSWDDWSGMLSGDDFVVPTGEAGKYNVFGGCNVSPRGGGSTPTFGYVQATIRDTTGVTIFDATNSTYDDLIASQGEFPKVVAVLDLADGDSVSLWVFNGTDKTVDLNNGGPPFSGWLAIEKLS